MKKFITTLVAAAILTTGGGIAFQGSAQSAAAVDPVRDGVHVIGDSIARTAHKATALSDPPPGWTHDAVDGRRLTALRNPLVPRSDDRQTAIDHMFTATRKSRISTAVIALGTNGLTREVSVEEAARYFRAAIRTLRGQSIWKPGPKRIVFVLPYAASRIEGDPYPRRQWASKGVVYSAAIRLVARQTPDVCVMPWRAVISANPDYLIDGRHPNRAGLRLWRTTLFETIRACAK